MLVQLKKRLHDLMKEEFPASEYKYYGIEVTQGYEVPAFFTQLKPVTIEANNNNTKRNVYTFYINYFQKEADEVDTFEKVEVLKNVFGNYVKVGERAVDVSNYSYDYVGQDNNILEISFDLEWSENTMKPKTEPVMSSVLLCKEMEE
ncbi:MAG: hypothetical protein SOY46_02430 [Butyrivibrio crossotus]|nr:hypothetical protein [Butyrivibrio crossotus]